MEDADFVSGHLDLAQQTGAKIYAPKAGKCESVDGRQEAGTMNIAEKTQWVPSKNTLFPGRKYCIYPIYIPGLLCYSLQVRPFNELHGRGIP